MSGVGQGKGVDLLFGLDMLRRYQAQIDLSQNCLIIQGRKLRFLDEHELPANGIGGSGDEEMEVDKDGNVVVPKAPEAVVKGAPKGQFPGTGQSLGTGPSSSSSSAPPSVPAASRPPPTQAASASRHDPSKVEALVGFGATREQAMELLDAAGGNVDVAASFLFGS